MEKFLDNLARQAEENPVLALGVAAGLITSISQLLNSGATLKNSNSWKKEVARRSKNVAKKS